MSLVTWKHSLLIMALLSRGPATCWAGALQQTPLPSGQGAQAQNSAANQPPRGRISGRVFRSDNGVPIAKASVTIWPATQPRESLTVRTDSAGAFEIKDVAPRAYRMRAQHRVFVPQLYGQKGSGPGLPLIVEAGQHLSRIDFRLEAAGTVSGTVFDEDREPVDGVEVFASRIRFSAGGRRQVVIVRSMRTDDAGSYRLPGLAPGLYYVQAGGRGEGVGITTVTSTFTYAPAYHPDATTVEEARTIQVGSGTETRSIDVTVRTTPTYSITGAIADAAEGGERRYSVGFARGGSTATMESPDGSFALRGLRPGDYTLVATVAEDGKPSRRGYQNVMIVDSDLRVVIPVGRTAEMRGNARLENGEEMSLPGFEYH